MIKITKFTLIGSNLCLLLLLKYFIFLLTLCLKERKEISNELYRHKINSFRNRKKFYKENSVRIIAFYSIKKHYITVKVLFIKETT